MNPEPRSLFRMNLPSAICLILVVAGCARSPDSPEVTLERARILMAQDQTASAIPLLDLVIEATPQNSEAFFQRGVAYETLELPEKALADYDACLKLDVFRTDALNNKAVQLAKLKRMDEAVLAFTELVDLDREDFLGYRNRGLCRFDLHDYANAMEDYNKAIGLNPADASSWFQRGNVHLAMNSLTEAESDYSKAIELDPDFAKAWMNRGVVNYRTDRKTEAAADLTKAQELDSNIVIPAIDVFTDIAKSASVTEVISDNSWKTCCSLAEKELSQRGFTELVVVREFPDLRCAELAGEIDGQPRTILVSYQQTAQSTVTVPCVDSHSTGDEKPSYALLVLQMPDEGTTTSEVIRFDMNWNPEPKTGEPLIMNYTL
jgi:tetratricopeptide (TPR) repeat protein